MPNSRLGVVTGGLPYGKVFAPKKYGLFKRWCCVSMHHVRTQFISYDKYVGAVEKWNYRPNTTRLMVWVCSLKR